MLKLAAVTLGLALVCGSAMLALAETITPPGPPDNRYLLPGPPDGFATDRLFEGRSIYRTEDPSTFYGGSDERGYPSGDPQNPRTGD